MLEGNDRFIPCRSSSQLLDGGRENRAPSTDLEQLLRRELCPAKGVLKFSSAPMEELKSTNLMRRVTPTAVKKTSLPTSRRIASSPFKMLRAPRLADDFYLSLVDWSSSNVLAVGLGSRVFLWSAITSKVSQLCDIGPGDSVSSVSWTESGNYLAVGTGRGAVTVFDATKKRVVRETPGHPGSRVGCLHWRGDLLASGSRDRTVCLRDLREKSTRHRDSQVIKGHRQEVCGLKWSPCGNYLATGGNDNKLLVWSAQNYHAGGDLSNARNASPVCRFVDHKAAVKAIAWSPHQRGLLASGAGTADRTIKLWDAQTSTRLESIDTGSQVCALTFSKTANEIVSTHGFSLNQICIWRLSERRSCCSSSATASSSNRPLRPINYATLTGHTQRVLYLAMSPDGSSMVTGAGDETLRFWNCFPSSKQSGPNYANDASHQAGSLLFPASVIR